MIIDHENMHMKEILTGNCEAVNQFAYKLDNLGNIEPEIRRWIQLGSSKMKQLSTI